jgi:hypothetical protein
MTIPYVDSTSSYIYSLATDFGNVIGPACLHREIQLSLGFNNLIGVFLEDGDDRVVIAFYSPLSSGEQTTLDSVVAAHDPDCNLDVGQTPISGIILNPQDGDLLIWDSTAGTWITGHGTLGLSSPEAFWESLGLQNSASDGVSSTTSITWQNKTSLTFNNDSSSSMMVRLGYTAEFNAANNNKATEVRLYESVLGVTHAGSYQQTNASTNWFVFSGFHVEEIPALSSRTFAIQFRVTPGIVTTCSIRNAELEAWRVS